jgi:hypothetical protein
MPEVCQTELDVATWARIFRTNASGCLSEGPALVEVSNPLSKSYDLFRRTALRP